MVFFTTNESRKWSRRRGIEIEKILHKIDFVKSSHKSYELMYFSISNSANGLFHLAFSLVRLPGRVVIKTIVKLCKIKQKELLFIQIKIC